MNKRKAKAAQMACRMVANFIAPVRLFIVFFCLYFGDVLTIHMPCHGSFVRVICLLAFFYPIYIGLSIRCASNIFAWNCCYAFNYFHHCNQILHSDYRTTQTI